MKRTTRSGATTRPFRPLYEGEREANREATYEEGWYEPYWSMGEAI